MKIKNVRDGNLTSCGTYSGTGETLYSKQTDYYHSQEVEKVIHKALDYWFTANPCV